MLRIIRLHAYVYTFMLLKQTY